MIKIIKLDPEKNPELIKEINGLVSDLVDTFFGDSFVNHLFTPNKEESKQVSETKKEPRARFDWITLGDLIDQWCKNRDTKKCKNPCNCTEKKNDEEDYTGIKNIDHII